MKIGGINTLTLLDYPDRVACIVFTAGCNFRCGFCHNPQFVLPEQIHQLDGNFIPDEKFFNFLKTRKGLLDAVVVSGGEPTMQPDLPEFCAKIKEMGFLVKLDTNGTAPDVVAKLIDKKLVDYIAMDIKMPLNEYAELVGVPVDPEPMQRTIDLIKKSGVDHEFRTTVIAEFHTPDRMKKIAETAAGCQRFTIQNFRNGKVLDPKFGEFTACTMAQLEEFKDIVTPHAEEVRVLE